MYLYESSILGKVFILDKLSKFNCQLMPQPKKKTEEECDWCMNNLQLSTGAELQEINWQSATGYNTSNQNTPVSHKILTLIRHNVQTTVLNTGRPETRVL